MGVITETDIDYGRIFGPFPAVGHIPPAHFIGLLTTDERNDSRNIKINLNERSLGNTWLPYVHPARTVEEQNMEAYTKDGLIYYRALRILRADEELLVWYSKDFGQILDIPDIRTRQDQDDNVLFTCEYCGEKFRYIFPLTAHVRFKCTRNTTRGGNSPRCPDKTDANNSPRTSDEKACNSATSESLPTLKRSAECEGSEPSPKRLTVEVTEENNNDKVSRKVSPVSTSGNDAGESFSAFRKVEKSHSNDAPVSQAGHTNSAYNIASLKNDTNTSDIYKSVMRSNSYNDSLTTGLGMLMPSWFVHQSSGGQPYIDPRVYADRIPTSAAEKIDALNRISGMNANAARSFPNSELINRQNMMLMEQLRKTQLPTMQTANPMVGKILSTTSSPSLMQRPLQQLNLAQNWCAKCNATFRMTSDLVYHMRSHHKREFDPMKRKREDKLQCNVCKETFKERHHLTRHMTSHA